MFKFLVILLTTSSCAFAQELGTPIASQKPGGERGVTTVAFGKPFASVVKGAPYSANVTIESTQTLSDGSQVVQHLQGNTARDSEGRTREDVPLPERDESMPHLVFIHDPVAQSSYALNLTDKTAQRMLAVENRPESKPESGTFLMPMGQVATVGPAPSLVVGGQAFSVSGDPPNDQVSTEDLGVQTREGLVVSGVRTIRSIPAGQIGNSKRINTVTEVWTSAELKTIVYSKMSDPLAGDQIFQVTNIVRAEPDPSLFTVPADFKITDAPADSED